MTKRPFWTNCIGMESGQRVRAIVDHDACRPITYATLARRVDLGPLRRADHFSTYRLSKDWHVGFFRSRLPNGGLVYFYKHSGIEFFFAHPEDVEASYRRGND